ncbi:MAG: hypothetical protein MJA31_11335 [Clostridia bacterium]|nr:hypothetical protein [Clostridia bacterium]
MKHMLEKLYYGELYSNEDVLPRGKEVFKVFCGNIAKMNSIFDFRA